MVRGTEDFGGTRSELGERFAVRPRRAEIAFVNAPRGLEQPFEQIARLPPELVDDPDRDRGARELAQPRGPTRILGLELDGQALALGDERLECSLVQGFYRVFVAGLHGRILPQPEPGSFGHHLCAIAALVGPARGSTRASLKPTCLAQPAKSAPV